jgi:hypothetical protein
MILLNFINLMTGSVLKRVRIDSYQVTENLYTRVCVCVCVCVCICIFIYIYIYIHD